MITGVPPFVELIQTKKELYFKIRNGDWKTQIPEVTQKVSQSLYDLLRGCFTVDPSQRYNSSSLVTHAFFKGLNNSYKDIPQNKVYNVFMNCRHFRPVYLF